MNEIVRCNGPVSRLSAIYEFFRQEPDFLSFGEQNIIIKKFKDKCK